MKAGILTLGCRVNQYESQALSEELERIGFEAGDFDEACDVYVINTCAVTEESVRKSRQMVRRAVKRNPGAFVVVTGCAAQLDSKAFEGIDGVGYICGTRNKCSAADAVKAWLSGGAYRRTEVTDPSGEIEKMKITRFERTRAYVKIQDGCNNKCAYCIIPSLRGCSVLRSEADVIGEVREIAAGGCHEVVLTGIETASYGAGLAGLIGEISKIDGIERIRMGSLEPSFVKKEFIDAIVNIPKVEHHFHLSVQSGCDSVLKAMRRKYSTAMLEERVKYIKEKMPDVMLSADIIVGFPGETDEIFRQTCDFLERTEFLHLHIFTYSRRPGTEAAEMEGQVEESVKTARLHVLSGIAERSRKKIYDRLITEGKETELLAETCAGGYITGHTGNFIECSVKASRLVHGGEDFRGRLFRVVPVSYSEDGRLICDAVKG